MSQIHLSAVVMVYNGVDTIARCLAGLLEACDEVIVVDDCSTDGTWAYLQSRASDRLRVVQNKHTTFAAQREFGRALARGSWVLTMDADEYVSPALASAMRAAISRSEAPDGFYLRRLNPYPRTLTGHYWTAHPRLVRTEKCRWEETDNPHSPLDIRGLKFQTLSGAHLDHEPLPDVATVLRKNINRSLIIAAQQRARGRKGGASSLLFSTLARFLRFYFGKSAFRFGASGLVMSISMAQEATAKAAFLIERPGQAPETLQDGGPGSYPAGTKFAN